mgnify:CR=1 FL=1
MESNLNSSLRCTFVNDRLSIGSIFVYSTSDSCNFTYRLASTGISNVFWRCWGSEFLLTPIFKGNSNFLIVNLAKFFGDISLIELLHESFVLRGVVFAELSPVNRESILVKGDPNLCVWFVSVWAILIFFRVRLSLLDNPFDIIWVLDSHTRLFSTSIALSSLLFIFVVLCLE